jgi:hypothetical protein
MNTNDGWHEQFQADIARLNHLKVHTHGYTDYRESDIFSKIVAVYTRDVIYCNMDPYYEEHPEVAKMRCLCSSMHQKFGSCRAPYAVPNNAMRIVKVECGNFFRNWGTTLMNEYIPPESNRWTADIEIKCHGEPVILTGVPERVIANLKRRQFGCLAVEYAKQKYQKRLEYEMEMARDLETAVWDSPSSSLEEIGVKRRLRRREDYDEDAIADPYAYANRTRRILLERDDDEWEEYMISLAEDYFYYYKEEAERVWVLGQMPICGDI